MVDIEICKLWDICGNSRPPHFECGIRDVDRFIKKDARKHHKRGQTITFCGREKPTGTLLGYYCLSMDAHPTSELPSKIKNGSHVQSEKAFPAVYMPYLGVNRGWQGKGIGEHLLMDAVDRAGLIAENVGYFGMTLRAISPETRKFYCKLGFVPFTDADTFPVLMILPRRSIVETREMAADSVE